MNRALVLACGNPLRGDDGIAVLLAHYLRDEFCEPETEIQFFQQWTPELAESVSQCEIVLFLDASATLRPGEVQLKRIEPAREISPHMSHSMSPDTLLALAAQLYCAAPGRAFLLTVGGASFEHADQISEPVRLAIPQALDLIKAALSGVSLPETGSPSKATAS
jgi:hydrogenase maturation protease